MKRLDLRQDFAEMYAYAASRVKSFDLAANHGPGKGKRVTRIDVGFGVSESGWACLMFDRRWNPESDGNSWIGRQVLCDADRRASRIGDWSIVSTPDRE